MGNKLLIGGVAVAAVAAYFYMRKDKQPAGLMSSKQILTMRQVVPESAVKAQAQESIASGGGSQIAGLGLMGLNGSGNSISTLINQIRTREIVSGAV